MEITLSAAHRADRQGGLTLIEVLITLVVAGILVSLTAPAFLNVIKNNQVTAAVNDLVGGMQLARTEAVKRRVPVTVCRSADPGEDAACGDGAGWQDGWLVFVDLNGNAVRDGNDEVLLRTGRSVQASDIEVTVSNNDDGLGNALTFLGSGFADLAAAVNPRVMLYCDQRGSTKNARAITIAQTGRPQARPARKLGALLNDLGMSCE